VLGDRRVGVVAKEMVFLHAKLDELFSFHARQQPGSSDRYSRQRIKRHAVAPTVQGRLSSRTA
jgi:hypothetical protein